MDLKVTEILFRNEDIQTIKKPLGYNKLNNKSLDEVRILAYRAFLTADAKEREHIIRNLRMTRDRSLGPAQKRTKIGKAFDRHVVSFFRNQEINRADRTLDKLIEKNKNLNTLLKQVEDTLKRENRNEIINLKGEFKAKYRKGQEKEDILTKINNKLKEFATTPANENPPERKLNVKLPKTLKTQLKKTKDSAQKLIKKFEMKTDIATEKVERDTIPQPKIKLTAADKELIKNIRTEFEKTNDVEEKKRLINKFKEKILNKDHPKNLAFIQLMEDNASKIVTVTDSTPLRHE